MLGRAGCSRCDRERFEEFPPREEPEGESGTADVSTTAPDSDASTPAPGSNASTPAPDCDGGKAGAETSGEENQSEPSKENAPASDDVRGGAAGSAAKNQDERVSVCNIGVGHKMDLYGAYCGA